MDGPSSCFLDMRACLTGVWGETLDWWLGTGDWRPGTCELRMANGEWRIVETVKMVKIVRMERTCVRVWSLDYDGLVVRTFKYDGIVVPCVCIPYVYIGMCLCVY
ncbi:hypothetical protein EJ05DRAFT_24456 [Pseudovirgaria hyperparasitica]|uniref:Uncharacterized protein n=1 Tax=Pseudovirgaria hyperparasitica TaxID=470096 RepID=A0A6A6WLN8_9PEZI|nr:uncharacterized protein EJ05DRAFT_24456 [Pseudovirgaria hyperparasitica]KAF2763068.1 hypothetical protein EJ05DRAFT_24456 [Pseudovirgaria hyperparasitica]